MPQYDAPLDDIRFTLEHIAGLSELTGLPDFAHVSTDDVLGVIAEFGRWASEVLVPLDPVGDRQGSVRHEDGSVTTPDGWKEAYKGYVEAGWGAVPFPEAYGGGGFPWTVAIVLQEILTAANMSFSLAPLLTQGAIDMLLHHGSEEQRETYLPKMVTGEWSGTMNLTEPDAGSDVGALRTRAVPAGDGTYRISGQKIFITYGEQDLTDNIVHLVLARLPDAPPGTKGISVFIVPKVLDDGSRNGVTCVSIEHKMGIHASPTCVLEYEDAVGYLIGEPNAGMRYMFTMMNNARLSVGLEGLALGERVWQQALPFAHERRQGRAVGAPAGESSPIADHADVRRMLWTMRSTIDALRALVYLNARCLDVARHHPDADERQRGQELADLLTPVTKAWGTDSGVELTSIAVQIHGGMGFIEETGVAQHYRDARIAPIYEGTNGIQAADLVARKLPMRGGGVVADFVARMRSVVAELSGDLEPVGSALSAALDDLESATRWMLERLPVEPNDALAGSVPYLRLFGIVTAGWLLARLALADGAGDRHVTAARFWADHSLPQSAGLAATATAGAATLYALGL